MSFLRFLRPATIAVPITGVAGGAVAAAGAMPPDHVGIACAIASAVLLTGASNVINQIADVETDRMNRPERPLPAGEFTQRQAWWIPIFEAVTILHSRYDWPQHAHHRAR